MQNTQTDMRPASPRQLLIEVIAGAIAGLAGGLALGFAAARLFVGTSGGWGDLIGAVLGSLVGYTLGAALGSYAASRRLTGRGSLGLSLVGSVLGAALVLLAAEPLGLNRSAALLQAAFVVVLPIAATVALNLRRLPVARPRAG